MYNGNDNNDDKLSMTMTIMIMQKVFLFHCDLVTPFNEIYLVHIGIGNGLLPDGHQAIT